MSEVFAIAFSCLGVMATLGGLLFVGLIVYWAITDPDTPPVVYEPDVELDRVAPVSVAFEPPLTDYTMKRLLDLAEEYRRGLDSVESAVCSKLRIDRGDGSDLYDLVVSAVRDGNGCPELVSQYNLRVYGVRWNKPTRSSYFSV